jgi:hypothetical protein
MTSLYNGSTMCSLTDTTFVCTAEWFCTPQDAGNILTSSETVSHSRRNSVIRNSCNTKKPYFVPRKCPQQTNPNLCNIWLRNWPTSSTAPAAYSPDLQYVHFIASMKTAALSQGRYAATSFIGDNVSVTVTVLWGTIKWTFAHLAWKRVHCVQ